MSKVNNVHKVISNNKTMLFNISEKVNIKKIILLGVFLLSIYSCFGPEDENNESFEYPLSIGNTWEYTHSWNMYSYSDTAIIQHQYEDTSTFSSGVSVKVTKKVTLENLVEAIEVVGVDSSITGINSMSTAINYYKNNNDGLFEYAYKSGGSIILLKKQSEGSIVFKGLKFKNYKQLSDFIQQAIPNQRVFSDSIIYEDPPLKILQYPIEIGDQWIFRQDNDPWRLDKKVIDKKDVELNVGTFECYEIKWLYDMDHDGEWDDDICVSDLISKQGLIQRIITINGIENTTVSGESGGYFDSVDSLILTDLNVELE
ncbi:MAG: hypothetical protein U9R41_08280 [Candidatus Marinimicrobia bacterium]|nr:hypothetical protein [Candidatus Neomarinimicrobiota bacterium]